MTKRATDLQRDEEAGDADVAGRELIGAKLEDSAEHEECRAGGDGQRRGSDKILLEGRLLGVLQLARVGRDNGAFARERGDGADGADGLARDGGGAAEHLGHALVSHDEDLLRQTGGECTTRLEPNDAASQGERRAGEADRSDSRRIGQSDNRAGQHRADALKDDAELYDQSCPGTSDVQSRRSARRSSWRCRRSPRS